MKLFTIGPVEMYQHTLEIGTQPIPYFRTSEFSELMLETDSLLKKIIGTKKSSETIYLTASGTAAMEATVMNCLDASDKVLVISGGTFGKRFEELCTLYEIEYTPVKLDTNEALTAKHLKAYDGKGYTAMLVNLHETSTGQLYDIKLISDFCKKNDLYLIVDAISTFLCDSYNMDQYGIDATIISSQKGLCLPPGISMVVLNEKIVEEKVRKIRPKSLYFNFKDYIENFKRGQTPFTPAVGILIQLHDMLKKIEEVGLEHRLLEVKEQCEHFRRNIAGLPIEIPNYPLSNALTYILFKNDIAMEIFNDLKNSHQIFVNPTGGVMKDRALRIAHVGALTKEDNLNLIQLIKNLLKR